MHTFYKIFSAESTSTLEFLINDFLTNRKDRITSFTLGTLMYESRTNTFYQSMTITMSE